ncbi:beta-phosphoglucomutase [Xylocopilactobacillus apicola]|uniref:Beta-phosphoglucomutase n=1 Tax=Xylocopilactobacillus apicola TaxID=2932184 RepID=A0AAU9D5I0_9LACO|nr:beta-phosphoglucomutase [Xylocopilactobacillus apicola]BDR58753.1 beta-phosphoglucomutase [Xylocopilactobacillus apicola]
MVTFSEISGFAFDLDGVITDTAKFHAMAWQQVAEQVGTKWTSQLADNLKGIDRMTSLEMILKAGGHETEYSDTEKEQLADEKNHNYVNLIKTLTPDDILPGMLDFIQSLHQNHYKLALASVSRNAPVILERLGLTDSFEGIVDPASLKLGKPDPEIYIRAAEVMHLDPDKVIGVEDAAAGVTSINKAGETSLGIGDAKILHEANLIFANTKEVTLQAIKEKMTAN